MKIQSRCKDPGEARKRMPKKFVLWGDELVLRAPTQTGSGKPYHYESIDFYKSDR